MTKDLEKILKGLDHPLSTALADHIQVDVAYVTPGIVYMVTWARIPQAFSSFSLNLLNQTFFRHAATSEVKQILQKHASIRCICASE